jgi:hypothetical protein
VFAAFVSNFVIVWEINKSTQNKSAKGAPISLTKIVYSKLSDVIASFVNLSLPTWSCEIYHLVSLIYLIFLGKLILLRVDSIVRGGTGRVSKGIWCRHLLFPFNLSRSTLYIGKCRSYLLGSQWSFSVSSLKSDQI